MRATLSVGAACDPARSRESSLPQLRRKRDMARLVVFRPVRAAGHRQLIPGKVHVLPFERNGFAFPHTGIGEQFHKVSAVPGLGLIVRLAV